MATRRASRTPSEGSAEPPRDNEGMFSGMLRRVRGEASDDYANRPSASNSGRSGSSAPPPDVVFAQTLPQVKELDLEARGHSAEKASQVVSTLLGIYKKRTFRKKHYRDLLFFLGFVAFYLSILFYQRNASDAFAVTNNLFTLFVPQGLTTFTDVQNVYDWIGGFLATTWKDPTCGDGRCEQPFEFSYYGHFGCKADCGLFNNQQNVSTVQIDLYYDFTHPPGSIPATTLFQQASWNLCPQEDAAINGPPIPHGAACYYEPDNEFPALKGHITELLDDAPDGFWQIVINNDLFQKVSGAVRNQANVTLDATVKKLYIAGRASVVAREAELQTLAGAYNAFVNITDPNLVASFYKTASDVALRTNLSTFASTQNTACAAYNLNNTYSVSVMGRRHLNLAPAVDAPVLEKTCVCQSGTLLAGYQASLSCACGGNATEACLTGWYYITSARSNAETKFRNMLSLLDQNAMDNATNVATLMLTQLQTDDPPSYDAINNANGDNYNDPTTASLPTMVQGQVDAGNKNSSIKMDMIRARSRTNVPFQNLTTLAYNRIYELQDLLLQPVSWPEIDHTYVSWTGGPNEYTTCFLPDRAPQYVGSCVAIANQSWLFPIGAPMTVANVNVDRTRVCASVCDCSPAALQDPDVFGDPCNPDPNAPPSANSSSSDPFAGVGMGGYVCSCQTCRSLNLQAVGGVSGRRRLLSDTGKHVRVTEDDVRREHPLIVRKRLLQQAGAPSGSSLNALADMVTGLQVSQGDLVSKVVTLQESQSAVSKQADTFFKSTTIVDTLKQGFQQLQDDHTSMMTTLDKLLDQQNQVLMQAQAAAAAAENLQNMAAQQQKALAAVTKAVTDQLNQIQQAVESGTVALELAHELQLQALIFQLQAEKQAMLANLPCNYASTNYPFDLNNYPPFYDKSAARFRLVGLTNRVVAGLLIYTRRTLIQKCNSRFDNIESECPSGVESIAPFGVDPVFKLNTNIYNQGLDNADSTLRYYNCTDPDVIPNPTYMDDSSLSNPFPYCKELFNAYNLPYGFYSKDLPGFSGGYPFFFDINLSADVATSWLYYMQDGLLLDPTKTVDMAAVLLTYNGELDHFGLSRVDLKFTAGGAIEISQSTSALRLDMYSGSSSDTLRLAGEIILALLVVISILMEGADMYETYQTKGSLGPFFANGWVYVDLASMAIHTATIVIWWITIIQHTQKFSPELRYDVYFNLLAPANFLRLQDGGVNLSALAQMFLDVQTIASLYQLYIALTGVNIVLCLLRILKLMDFQPRLGVITHTMFLAASDLGHFFFIFSIIFFAFSIVGHLMFGYFSAKFQDAPTAINTCFTNLLGDTSWFEDIQQLTGLQRIVGTAYFWIFQICMVLILLNFLLAIICDAFGEVKGNASESTSVLEEVGPMMSELWRSITDKTHIPEAMILKQLKVWHGDLPESLDIEEEEEESKEKVIKLDDDQVTREELIEIVRQCVKDSLAKPPRKTGGQPWLMTSASQREATSAAAESAVSAGRSSLKAETTVADPGLGGIIRRRLGMEPKKAKRQTVVTEDDVVRAADMLLDQCGEDREEEEEEEDFASLTEALERMLAGQQRLIEGQRLVVEGQQRVASAEKRIEEMHKTIQDLLGPVGDLGTGPSAADAVLKPIAGVMGGVAAGAANLARALSPPRAGERPRAGSSAGSEARR